MDLSLKSYSPHWEGPEHIPFSSTLRNRFVRGAPASLKNSVIALLYRPDLTVGTTVTQWENLNAMGIIGSPGGPSQVVALNYKVSIVTLLTKKSQNSLTPVDLWHWLINHGIPRSQIDGRSTTVLLDLHKQETSRTSEQKSSLNHKSREPWPHNRFPDLSQF